LIPFTLFSETFLIPRITERGVIQMCIGPHVNYLLCLLDFSKTRFIPTDFRKIFKYKFLENLSSGNRAAPCGRRDRHENMTILRKLKNCDFFPKCIYVFCIFRTRRDFVLYYIKRLVFKTEVKSVYCAVRTQSLNKTIYASSLKG